ncbi:ABC transporter permease [Pseudoalteromonas denitrificans]|uniref:Putative ABC transport system permease protein n=1 Tax=Pseudoalteromonas denitrificans DSM 6059 TaxID=1123010 RepID=A0A1I1Q0X7_9GAMM|nr:FtsX-like permease family protein [Pseudoalteromonas denitrificans]SFD15811.1 putative ABC transport system permease protein [Pseudoalteromonas denitrificans DSM 6059]
MKKLILLLNQGCALTWINFKSFPHRIASSSISILSIACVAAVMLAVLALTDGMVKTMARTGLDNTLLVMRSGAVSELQSVMFPVEVNILANHQQIIRDKNDRAIVSAEMFVNAEFKSKSGVNDQSLSLRGINNNTYLFRPNFKLIEGAKFKTGLRQVLVGRSIARKIPELKIGSTIILGDSSWLVSGIFSDNNSVFESELWADIGIVQSDYQRGNTVQSVRLAMHDGTNINKLNEVFEADPRLNVRIIEEKVFFAQQAQDLTRLIRWIGSPVALIMAFGALIAALNTMYAAISSRSKEIATHKTIGFTPFAISISILSEAMLLACIGGLLGVLPLYLFLNDVTAATQNANSLSQMMFNFKITPFLMAQAMLLSVSIGLIGGVLPAIKAMRLPVTLALRDN